MPSRSHPPTPRLTDARRSTPAGKSGTTSDADAVEALRCCCGSLLARIVDAAVELKCRRCKRVVLLPLSPPGTGPPYGPTLR